MIGSISGSPCSNRRNRIVESRKRLIFHIDVNSAYLSWTAVEQLKNGAKVDIREIPAIIGGDFLCGAIGAHLRAGKGRRKIHFCQKIWHPHGRTCCECHS